MLWRDNRRAAFAPDAVAFIHSLPDDGGLLIKTTRRTDGKINEANFSLGAASEIRNKIAKHAIGLIDLWTSP